MRPITSRHDRTAATTRMVALAAVCALLATACGSRLNEDQVQAYAGAGGGGAQVQSGTGTAGGGQGSTDGTGAAPGTSGGTTDGTGQAGTASGTTGGDTSGGTSGGGTSGGDSGGGTSGGDSGGGTSGGDGGAQQAAGGDTRAAPPGGNGGATDVGVTKDQILVYNVADLSGAVPGLFRDAYEATLAYFQYFTATEGTIYGRQLKLESRDTQLSSQGNRTAYLDACQKAFAAVGSMSAFEEGAADPLSDCGMPDLRNTPTSKALQQLDNAKGVMGFRPGDYSKSEWEYYKQQYPDAIKNAGFVWLENNTTNYQVSQYIRGTSQSLGYQWNKKIRVAVSETNYARIVTELKNANIQFVAFQGAYQQASRLAESMQQQNYAPKVFALQSNIYTPDLIKTCGAACEDFVRVAANSALREEMASNEELQLYEQWLKRVNPNARPTGVGMYSWAAAKLFVQALKEIGPEPTRAKLLEYLNGVSGYTANGLIPKQNVGTQKATGCTVILDIKDGKFVRIAPQQGYNCSAGRVDA